MHKKKLLVVGLVAVITVAMVSSVFVKKSEASSVFSVNVRGSNSVQVDQAGSYSASVTNDGDAISGAIVDLEVHDASGAKVFQQFFANQNFGTGQTQSYSASWTPTASGIYTVDVGVFTSNWSSVLYWSETLSVRVNNSTQSFSSAVNAPSTALANQPVAIGSMIQNLTGVVSNDVVDLEVHDASGAKVFQQFFANQNFGTGQTQSYSASWTPTASGIYTVDVGVFTSNWSSVLYWKSGATVKVAQPVVMAQNISNTTAVSSGFYVDPNSSAATQAALWQSSDSSDAAGMQLVASQPEAVWFGGWNANVTTDVSTLVSAAQTAGKMPVLVAYNIPDRDCGGYSAGGAETASAYESWIQAFAVGIGARPATVILEPDALAGLDCLSAADQSTRLSLLSYAVQTLKSLGKTTVYLDAGNSNWISASTMATRLQGADIAAADGFSLNVSNFYTTASNTEYGTTLSALVGGKHFVIDTSRNGSGSDGQWCNPPGRSLGLLPTTNTGNSLIDAYLWVKPVGESDGTCNGGPSAGTWWPQYAAGLAASAGY